MYQTFHEDEQSRQEITVWKVLGILPFWRRSIALKSHHCKICMWCWWQWGITILRSTEVKVKFTESNKIKLLKYYKISCSSWELQIRCDAKLNIRLSFASDLHPYFKIHRMFQRLDKKPALAGQQPTRDERDDGVQRQCCDFWRGLKVIFNLGFNPGKTQRFYLGATFRLSCCCLFLMASIWTGLICKLYEKHKNSNDCYRICVTEVIKRQFKQNKTQNLKTICRRLTNSLLKMAHVHFTYYCGVKLGKQTASPKSTQSSSTLLHPRWLSVQHLVTEWKKILTVCCLSGCKPVGQCDTKHFWVWRKITVGADRRVVTTWKQRTQAAIHVSGWEGLS